MTPGLLEDVAELEGQGYPLDVAAERLGTSRDAVYQARLRAKRATS